MVVELVRMKKCVPHDASRRVVFAVVFDHDDTSVLPTQTWNGRRCRSHAGKCLVVVRNEVGEVLRLRISGLKAGTSTTLDLIDAQLNHAKVQTERAQAAHDYVLALAALLESSGLSDEFANYMARADVKVD